MIFTRLLFTGPFALTEEKKKFAQAAVSNTPSDVPVVDSLTHKDTWMIEPSPKRKFPRRIASVVFLIVITLTTVVLTDALIKRNTEIRSQALFPDGRSIPKPVKKTPLPAKDDPLARAAKKSTEANLPKTVVVPPPVKVPQQPAAGESKAAAATAAEKAKKEAAKIPVAATEKAGNQPVVGGGWQNTGYADYNSYIKAMQKVSELNVKAGKGNTQSLLKGNTIVTDPRTGQPTTYGELIQSATSVEQVDAFTASVNQTAPLTQGGKIALEAAVAQAGNTPYAPSLTVLLDPTVQATIQQYKIYEQAAAGGVFFPKEYEELAASSGYASSQLTALNDLNTNYNNAVNDYVTSMGKLSGVNAALTADSIINSLATQYKLDKTQLKDAITSNTNISEAVKKQQYYTGTVAPRAQALAQAKIDREADTTDQVKMAALVKAESDYATALQGYDPTLINRNTIIQDFYKSEYYKNVIAEVARNSVLSKATLEFADSQFKAQTAGPFNRYVSAAIQADVQKNYNLTSEELSRITAEANKIVQKAIDIQTTGTNIAKSTISIYGKPLPSALAGFGGKTPKTVEAQVTTEIQSLKNKPGITFTPEEWKQIESLALSSAKETLAADELNQTAWDTFIKTGTFIPGYDSKKGLSIAAVTPSIDSQALASVSKKWSLTSEQAASVRNNAISMLQEQQAVKDAITIAQNRTNQYLPYADKVFKETGVAPTYAGFVASQEKAIGELKGILTAVQLTAVEKGWQQGQILPTEKLTQVAPSKTDWKTLATNYNISVQTTLQNLQKAYPLFRISSVPSGRTTVSPETVQETMSGVSQLGTQIANSAGLGWATGWNNYRDTLMVESMTPSEIRAMEDIAAKTGQSWETVAKTKVSELFNEIDRPFSGLGARGIVTSDNRGIVLDGVLSGRITTEDLKKLDSQVTLGTAFFKQKFNWNISSTNQYDLGADLVIQGTDPAVIAEAKKNMPGYAEWLVQNDFVSSPGSEQAYYKELVKNALIVDDRIQNDLTLSRIKSTMNAQNPSWLLDLATRGKVNTLDLALKTTTGALLGNSRSVGMGTYEKAADTFLDAVSSSISPELQKKALDAYTKTLQGQGRSLSVTHDMAQYTLTSNLKEYLTVGDKLLGANAALAELKGNTKSFSLENILTSGYDVKAFRNYYDTNGFAKAVVDLNTTFNGDIFRGNVITEQARQSMAACGTDACRRNVQLEMLRGDVIGARQPIALISAVVLPGFRLVQAARMGVALTNQMLILMGGEAFGARGGVMSLGSAVDRCGTDSLGCASDLAMSGFQFLSGGVSGQALRGLIGKAAVAALGTEAANAVVTGTKEGIGALAPVTSAAKADVLSDLAGTMGLNQMMGKIGFPVFALQTVDICSREGFSGNCMANGLQTAVAFARMRMTLTPATSGALKTVDNLDKAVNSLQAAVTCMGGATRGQCGEAVAGAGLSFGPNGEKAPNQLDGMTPHEAMYVYTEAARILNSQGDVGGVTGKVIDFIPKDSSIVTVDLGGGKTVTLSSDGIRLPGATDHIISFLDVNGTPFAPTDILTQKLAKAAIDSGVEEAIVEQTPKIIGQADSNLKTLLQESYDTVLQHQEALKTAEITLKEGQERTNSFQGLLDSQGNQGQNNIPDLELKVTDARRALSDAYSGNSAARDVEANQRELMQDSRSGLDKFLNRGKEYVSDFEKAVNTVKETSPNDTASYNKAIADLADANITLSQNPDRLRSYTDKLVQKKTGLDAQLQEQTAQKAELQTELARIQQTDPGPRINEIQRQLADIATVEAQSTSLDTRIAKMQEVTLTVQTARDASRLYRATGVVQGLVVSPVKRVVEAVTTRVADYQQARVADTLVRDQIGITNKQFGEHLDTLKTNLDPEADAVKWNDTERLISDVQKSVDELTVAKDALTKKITLSSDEQALLTVKEAELTRATEELNSLQDILRRKEAGDIPKDVKPFLDGGPKLLAQEGTRTLTVGEIDTKIAEAKQNVPQGGDTKNTAYLKAQNEVFVLEKQKILAEQLDAIQQKIDAMETGAAMKIELGKKKAKLENVSKVFLDLGPVNERVSAYLENKILEHELARSRIESLAGKEPTLISLDALQIRALLDVLRTNNITIEFALAGGKTTIIGPLYMKIGAELYGRKGLITAQDGQSWNVYDDIALTLTQDPTKFHEVIVKNSNGVDAPHKVYEDVPIVNQDTIKNLPELAQSLRNGRHIIQDPNAPGFIADQILKPGGTIPELMAAVEVKNILTHNIQGFIDEVHINADPSKHQIINVAGERSLSLPDQEAITKVLEKLKGLGIVKRGEQVSEVKGLVESKTNVNSTKAGLGLTDAARLELQRLVEKETGLDLTVVKNIFENPVTEDARTAALPDGLQKEQMTKALRMLEVVNEFDSQLGLNKGTDITIRKDTNGGKLPNAMITTDNNAQPDQRHNSILTAGVFEAIASEISGIDPNLAAVKAGGKSTRSSFADWIFSVRNDRNSHLAAGSGTIGPTKGTLESAYGMAVRETTTVLHKFFGMFGDQGAIATDHIRGIGENITNIDALQKSTLKGINDIKAESKLSKMHIVAGGGDLNAKQIFDLLRNDATFMGGKDHTFYVMDAERNWTKYEVSADGKTVVETPSNYKEAQNILVADGVENATVIGGKNSATGVNIYGDSSVVGIDLINVTTGRYQYDQSVARFNRKDNGEQAFVLVAGIKEGVIPDRSAFRSMIDNIETAQNKINTYKAVSSALENSATRPLKQIIDNGRVGSMEVTLAKEVLLELQNPPEGKNYGTGQGQIQSPLEALQTQLKHIQSTYKEISSGGKYRSLYLALERSGSPYLSDIRANGKSFTLSVASDRSKATGVDPVFNVKNVGEFVSSFGKTITSADLPEKVSGGILDQKLVAQGAADNGSQTPVDDGGVDTGGAAGQAAPPGTAPATGSRVALTPKEVVANLASGIPIDGQTGVGRVNINNAFTRLQTIVGIPQLRANGVTLQKELQELQPKPVFNKDITVTQGDLAQVGGQTYELKEPVSVYRSDGTTLYIRTRGSQYTNPDETYVIVPDSLNLGDRVSLVDAEQKAAERNKPIIKGIGKEISVDVGGKYAKEMKEINENDAAISLATMYQNEAGYDPAAAVDPYNTLALAIQENIANLLEQEIKKINPAITIKSDDISMPLVDAFIENEQTVAKFIAVRKVQTFDPTLTGAYNELLNQIYSFVEERNKQVINGTLPANQAIVLNQDKVDQLLIALTAPIMAEIASQAPAGTSAQAGQTAPQKIAPTNLVQTILYAFDTKQLGVQLRKALQAIQNIPTDQILSEGDLQKILETILTHAKKVYRTKTQQEYIMSILIALNPSTQAWSTVADIQKLVREIQIEFGLQPTPVVPSGQQGSTVFLDTIKIQLQTTYGYTKQDVDRMETLAMNVLQEYKSGDLLTKSKTVQLTDEEQEMSGFADMIAFLIERNQLILIKDDNPQQIGVLLNWMRQRDGTIKQLAPLFEKAKQHHEVLRILYGGGTIDEKTLDPKRLKIIMLDEAQMKVLNSGNPNAFYNPKFDVLVFNDSYVTAEPQRVQRTIDHELSHLINDAGKKQLKDEAEKYFGATDAQAWARFINEGRTDLIAYNAEMDAAEKENRTPNFTRKQFLDNSNESFAKSFEVFDISIRSKLYELGITNYEEETKLLLGLGTNEYQPLVDALGGWNVFFTFFDKPELKASMTLLAGQSQPAPAPEKTLPVIDQSQAESMLDDLLKGCSGAPSSLRILPFVERVYAQQTCTVVDGVITKRKSDIAQEIVRLTAQKLTESGFRSQYETFLNSIFVQEGVDITNTNVIAARDAHIQGVVSKIGSFATSVAPQPVTPPPPAGPATPAPAATTPSQPGVWVSRLSNGDVSVLFETTRHTLKVGKSKMVTLTDAKGNAKAYTLEVKKDTNGIITLTITSGRALIHKNISVPFTPTEGVAYLKTLLASKPDASDIVNALKSVITSGDMRYVDIINSFSKLGYNVPRSKQIIDGLDAFWKDNTQVEPKKILSSSEEENDLSYQFLERVKTDNKSIPANNNRTIFQTYRDYIQEKQKQDTTQAKITAGNTKLTVNRITESNLKAVIDEYSATELQKMFTEMGWKMDLTDTGELNAPTDPLSWYQQTFKPTQTAMINFVEKELSNSKPNAFQTWWKNIAWPGLKKAGSDFRTTIGNLAGLAEMALQRLAGRQVSPLARIIIFSGVTLAVGGLLFWVFGAPVMGMLGGIGQWFGGLFGKIGTLNAITPLPVKVAVPVGAGVVGLALKYPWVRTVLTAIPRGVFWGVKNIFSIGKGIGPFMQRSGSWLLPLLPTAVLAFIVFPQFSLPISAGIVVGYYILNYFIATKPEIFLGTKNKLLIPFNATPGTHPLWFGVTRLILSGLTISFPPIGFLALYDFSRLFLHPRRFFTFTTGLLGKLFWIPVYTVVFAVIGFQLILVSPQMIQNGFNLGQTNRPPLEASIRNQVQLGVDYAQERDVPVPEWLNFFFGTSSLPPEQRATGQPAEQASVSEAEVVQPAETSSKLDFSQNIPSGNKNYGNGIVGLDPLGEWILDDYPSIKDDDLLLLFDGTDIRWGDVVVDDGVVQVEIYTDGKGKPLPELEWEQIPIDNNIPFGRGSSGQFPEYFQIYPELEAGAVTSSQIFESPIQLALPPRDTVIVSVDGKKQTRLDQIAAAVFAESSNGLDDEAAQRLMIWVALNDSLAPQALFQEGISSFKALTTLEQSLFGDAYDQNSVYTTGALAAAEQLLATDASGTPNVSQGQHDRMKKTMELVQRVWAEREAGLRDPTWDSVYFTKYNKSTADSVSRMPDVLAWYGPFLQQHVVGGDITLGDTFILVTGKKDCIYQGPCAINSDPDASPSQPYFIGQPQSSLSAPVVFSRLGYAAELSRQADQLGQDLQESEIKNGQKIFTYAGRLWDIQDPDGSNICGPLSVEILKRGGYIPSTVTPRDYWKLNLALSEKQAMMKRDFEDTGTYVHEQYKIPIGSFDFSANRLQSGDFIYMYGSENVPHMVAVTEVDADGTTSGWSNVRQPDGTFQIQKVTFFNPSNPSDSMFYQWNGLSGAAPYGLFGTGGFEWWRVTSGQPAAVQSLQQPTSARTVSVITDDAAVRQDMEQAYALFAGIPLAQYLPTQITIDKREVGSLGTGIVGQMLSSKHQADGSIVSEIALTDQYREGGHFSIPRLQGDLLEKNISMTEDEISNLLEVDPVLGALAHEIMHGVVKWNDGQETSPFFEAFQQIFYVGKSDAPAVTHYANTYLSSDTRTYLTRQYEDFSDVMTLYKIAPSILKLLDPQKYNFAELLFSGMSVSQIQGALIGQSSIPKSAPVVSAVVLNFQNIFNSLAGVVQRVTPKKQVLPAAKPTGPVEPPKSKPITLTPEELENAKKTAIDLITYQKEQTPENIQDKEGHIIYRVKVTKPGMPEPTVIAIVKAKGKAVFSPIPLENINSLLGEQEIRIIERPTFTLTTTDGKTFTEVVQGLPQLVWQGIESEQIPSEPIVQEQPLDSARDQRPEQTSAEPVAVSIYEDQPAFLEKTKETLITTFGFNATVINSLKEQTLMFLGHRIADPLAARPIGQIKLVGNEPIYDENGREISFESIQSRLEQQTQPRFMLTAGAIGSLEANNRMVLGTFDVTGTGNANDVPTEKEDQGGDILLLKIMNAGQEALNVAYGEGQYELDRTSGDEFVVTQPPGATIPYDTVYAVIENALKGKITLSHENGRTIAKPPEIHKGRDARDNPYLNTEPLKRDPTLETRKSTLMKYVPTKTMPDGSKRGIEQYLTDIASVTTVSPDTEKQLIGFLEDSIYDPILFNHIPDMEQACGCTLLIYTHTDAELFWDVMDKKSGWLAALDTAYLMKKENDMANYQAGNKVIVQEADIQSDMLGRSSFRGRRVTMKRRGAGFITSIDGATEQEMVDLQNTTANQIDTDQVYQNPESGLNGYPLPVGLGLTHVTADDNTPLSVLDDAEVVLTDQTWLDQLARLGRVFSNEEASRNEQYLKFLDDFFNPNDTRGLRRLTLLNKGKTIDIGNEQALYTTDRPAFRQRVIGLLTGKTLIDSEQSRTASQGIGEGEAIAPTFVNRVLDTAKSLWTRFTNFLKSDASQRGSLNLTPISEWIAQTTSRPLQFLDSLSVFDFGFTNIQPLDEAYSTWDKVTQSPKSTVLTMDQIHLLPKMRGRNLPTEQKPKRNLYPVEIVNALFFQAPDAEKGKEIVAEYLAARDSNKDVSMYENMATDFYNTHKKEYDLNRTNIIEQLGKEITDYYNVTNPNDVPTENIDDVVLVRAMQQEDPIGLDSNGNVVIQHTFLGQPEKSAQSLLRTSKHFAVNGVVQPVSSQSLYGTKINDWSSQDVIIITPMNEFVHINGTPDSFLVQDTWWTPGVYDNLVLPKGTIIIVKDGNSLLEAYSQLPGMVLIISKQPFNDADLVVENMGYTYKAQRTENSNITKPSEEFLNEGVFAQKIGAHSTLDSTSFQNAAELEYFIFANDRNMIQQMIVRWSKGELSQMERVRLISNLLYFNYFGAGSINGITILRDALPYDHKHNKDYLLLDTTVTNGELDYSWNTFTFLTRFSKIEALINQDIVQLPDFWTNEGVFQYIQQELVNKPNEPSMSSVLPLIAPPELFGLIQKDQDMLRNDVNEKTRVKNEVGQPTQNVLYGSLPGLPQFGKWLGDMLQNRFSWITRFQNVNLLQEIKNLFARVRGERVPAQQGEQQVGQQPQEQVQEEPSQTTPESKETAQIPSQSPSNSLLDRAGEMWTKFVEFLNNSKSEQESTRNQNEENAEKPLNMLTPLLQRPIIVDYADESLSTTKNMPDHITIIDTYVRMKYSKTVAEIYARMSAEKSVFVSLAGKSSGSREKGSWGSSLRMV